MCTLVQLELSLFLTPLQHSLPPLKFAADVDTLSEEHLRAYLVGYGIAIAATWYGTAAAQRLKAHLGFSLAGPY